MKTHTVVFRPLILHPFSAETEIAGFSPAMLRVAKVMLATRHHTGVATPTGFARAWASRVNKGCTFGRRIYSWSTAQDFDLRAHV